MSICAGAPRRTRIVAEIGNNHNGDVAIAHRMIDAAADAKVDSVKLQIRDVWLNPPAEWADRLYNGSNSYGQTYLEHRRALELERSEYASVVAHAHDRGLECGASIWDAQSLGVAMAIGVDWLKAPSALITTEPVMRALEWAAIYHGFPIVLSCGMSTEGEVRRAVEDYAWPGRDKLTLLHCTSAYPCENRDVHLVTMAFLRAAWGDRAQIGISGHWCGIQIDAAAVALGAEMIERHMTLSRVWKGTDHAASLEPHGLECLVRDVRAVEDAMGEAKIQVLACEEGPRRKLRGAS